LQIAILINLEYWLFFAILLRFAMIAAIFQFICNTACSNFALTSLIATSTAGSCTSGMTARAENCKKQLPLQSCLYPAIFLFLSLVVLGVIVHQRNAPLT